MKRKFNDKNIAHECENNFGIRKKMPKDTDLNLKKINQNIKSNTKNIIDNYDNHKFYIGHVKDFGAKDDLEKLDLDDLALNKIVKESFEKDKNRKKAESLIKEIMSITSHHEKDSMKDFIKNILAVKNLRPSKAQEINKDNAKIKNNKIPKTNNNNNNKIARG